MKDELESELLSAYLDGRLSPDERARVDDLLAAQPAARKLLEELRSVGAALKSLPRQKLGEDLSESVLEIAQRRKQAGSATEPKPEKSADAAEREQKITAEPTPVYSTILRRLKNPRLWAWEIVIAVVAILLMVYYPGRNAGGGRQAGADADRSIAMAAKPAAEQAPSDAGEIRAAPSSAATASASPPPAPVSVAPAPQESVNSSRSYDDSKAPAETSPARMSGTTADKADAVERLEAQKSAVETYADVRHKAAMEGTSSAKKESETVGGQIATKNLPTRDFGSADKGASAEVQSPEPTAGPASPTPGLAAEGKAKTGGASVAGNAVISKSMSNIQPALQLDRSESAARGKSPDAAGGELLVVRCQIAPGVLENHVFEKILADNSIVWSDEQKERSTSEKLPAQDTGGSLLEPGRDLAQSRPKGALGGRKQVQTQAGESGVSGFGMSVTAPVQMVYVEASPAQIEATLKGLSVQAGLFKNVSVAPASGDSRLAGAAYGGAAMREPVKAGQGGWAYGSQPAQSAEAEQLLQSQPGSDVPAAAQAALGRARRVPLADVNNVKDANGSPVGKEMQQKTLAHGLKKELPGAVDYGAMIAGRQSDTESAGRLAFDLKSQTSLAQGAAQIQRVLFVFEVAEETSAAARGEGNVPANAAEVAAPPADADRPKP
jgi:anti-sigma factor RsiW